MHCSRNSRRVSCSKYQPLPARVAYKQAATHRPLVANLAGALVCKQASTGRQAESSRRCGNERTGVQRTQMHLISLTAALTAEAGALAQVAERAKWAGDSAAAAADGGRACGSGGEMQWQAAAQPMWHGRCLNKAETPRTSAGWRNQLHSSSS